MKVKCKNCGAMIDSNQVTCPYCSAVQLEASDKEYMSNLHQIKDEMDLTDDIEKKQVIQATVRKCLITVGIIAIAILAAVGMASIFERNSNSYGISKKEIKQSINWYEENVDQLTKYVESGDMDDAVSLAETIGDSYSFRTLLKRWKYYHLLMVYQDSYGYFTERMEDLEKNPDDDDYYFVSCYEYAMEFLDIGWDTSSSMYRNNVEKMSEYERRVYEGWNQVVRDFFFEKVGMTSADIEDDLSILFESGYSDYEQLKSFGKMRYESYKKLQK